MDTEDAGRIAKHLSNLLEALKAKRVLTNTEVRQIAGSRGMGRVNELQKRGEPITVRKLTGSIWEVRYDAPPLARPAEMHISASPLHDTLFDLHPGAFQR